MSHMVVILHYSDEEEQAERIAEFLRIAGYEAWHTGDVLVGEQFAHELQDKLALEGPLVICGTTRAVGSKWVRFFMNAVRDPNSSSTAPRVFPVRLEKDADLERFARNRGIFVNFPELEVSRLQPFCYVDFETRRTEMHIHTFAAYPDQVTMVKTQSLFDFQ